MTQQNNPAILKLRGKSISDLREIAEKHLILDENIDISELSQSDLTDLIAKDIPKNRELRNEVNRLSYSFKPSFYLMFIGEKYGVDESNIKSVELRLRKVLGDNNNLIQRKTNPSIKEYRLESFRELEKNVFQLDFTWQKIHWYWAPEYDFKNVYELQFGLAVIDLNTKKAIITCHNKKEKESIAGAIAQAFGIKLSTLVLTRPLLGLIGSFDQVKKARYFVVDSESKFPENVTYADPNLGSFPVVYEQENNPVFQRKESFYRVTLGDVLEQGIGVTSDSGKLWMPQILTVAEIREFSSQLLYRISDTLDELTGSGNYSTVLETLGITNLDEFKQIKSVKLRNEIYRLLISLINMIDRGENERPFTLSKDLVCNGVPKYFNYPQVQIYDEETESNSWFHWNSLTTFKVVEDEGKFHIQTIDSKEILDFNNMRTPYSSSLIEDVDILSSLRLIPSHELKNVIIKALSFCSSQIPSLRNLPIPIFRIEVGRLIIDQKRSKGLIRFSDIMTSIAPNEIDELKQVMNKELSSNRIDDLVAISRKLREKCEQMTDDNCELCVIKKDFVCVRSMIASFMKNLKLLAHKGIELSDIQGTLHIDGTEIRVFGFAKEINGPGGLTARNHQGAVLLSQILGQIDKTDFNTVAVISSATLNEDLINRIKVICSSFNKKLILFDLNALLYMINDWENSREFEGIKPEDIYRASNPSLKKLFPKVHKLAED